MLVRACALGQASSSLFAAHAIGRTPDELAVARDQLTAWLAGEGPLPDWPDLDIFTPALPVTARHPSIRLAFEAAADAAAQGSRLMGDGSMLRDGVVMLGAGLVFVILFRRLGLGATLGFLVAGALIGPQAFHLIGDAEGKIGVAELGITLLLFIVGLELNPSRLWKMKQDIFALGALQVVTCGLAVSAIVHCGRQHDLGRGARARPAARAVVDRAGAADAAIGGAAAHPVRRARVRDPAVPGPVDHPADHARHDPVAQPRRHAAGRRAGCCSSRPCSRSAG